MFRTISRVGCMLFLIGLPSARCETIPLDATQDNTLYEDSGGAVSNGAGEYLFVGRVGFTPAGSNEIRRGLLKFDVAGNVPAGATIDSVSLTLHMSKSKAGTENVALHEALADWGEGASDAPENEGKGTNAATGDATWLHTFFATSLWTNPGGDFDLAASASISVAGIEDYTWGSTTELVADVQGWLDDPSNNRGWLLKGRETEGAVTAKRFDTRQNTNPEFRPDLTVNYTPSLVPAPSASVGLIGMGLTVMACFLWRRRGLV